MSKKLGRNDPCHCGSGKKYKKCCLEKDKGVPNIQRSIGATRKAFAKKYCMHPDASPAECSGNIVRAHTLQRSGVLSRIARAGHVYGWPLDPSALFKNNGRLLPELIGIKNASTFTGFCGHHDTFIFAPLETNPFGPTSEQLFLLAYRGIARELFTKSASASLGPERDSALEQLPVELRGLLETTNRDFQTGTDLGQGDLATRKTEFDDCLLKKDFSSLRYYLVRFRDVPTVLCSGAILVEMDFDGNRLQDIGPSNGAPSYITCSCIAVDGGGAMILAWLGNDEVSKAFVESVHRLPDDEISSAIIRFAFEHFENTYFEPDWWEALNEGQRQKLIGRFNVAMSPIQTRETRCLIADGEQYADWGLVGRQNNLGL